MARSSASLTPAADAGALLRRLGFATLFCAVPVLGFLFRRGVVVALPIGLALIVVATLLDGQRRPLREIAGRLAISTGVAATILLVAWAAVSALWSPARSLALERLGGLLASPALALLAYLALPDRTRAANLYLLPLGIFIATVTALCLVVAGPSWPGAEEGQRNVERGLAALALLLWPAIAWLRSRTRDLEASALALATAAAIALGPQGATVAALAAGAGAYTVVALAGPVGAILVGLVGMAGLVLAPGFALLGPPGAGLPLGRWGDVIAADPVRVWTGRGFGELVRLRLAGGVPASVPDTLPVALWFDLGIVGALAGGATIVACMTGAARSYGPLLPGIAAALATGSVMAAAGIGAGQAWWPAILSVLVLAFVAAERGQFRTRRPQAGALAPA